MPVATPTRTGRLLTQADRDQILKEANEPGCNRSALADKWGVSRAYIYLLLNPASFKPPAPVDLVSSHEIAKLRRTLRLSLRQFADLLAVDEATIRGWEDDGPDGWLPRAASRHRLLEIAKEHGLPLEFLASDRTLKSVGLEIKNPITREDRKHLKERGKQRQDFRRRIVEPPQEPTAPVPPPPKKVTVGNRSAFVSADKLFGGGR
jgi:DNA-binding transcriptional regulator YiaG